MAKELFLRNGFTLAEVVMAMFLLSGMAVAMTSVPLLAKMVLVKQSMHAMMTEQTRGVANELHSFVADGNYIASLPATTTGWALAYDSCTGCSTFGGGAGKCWAMESGCTHNVTGHLPASLSAAPYNATLFYTVNVSMINDFQIRVSSFTYSYATF